jgi:hypothetical protein
VECVLCLLFATWWVCEVNGLCDARDDPVLVAESVPPLCDDDGRGWVWLAECARDAEVEMPSRSYFAIQRSHVHSVSAGNLGRRFQSEQVEDQNLLKLFHNTTDSSFKHRST